MYTEILFNPLLKYIFIFILAYMFFNKINIPLKYLPLLLTFTIVSNIVFDVLMLDEYLFLLKNTSNNNEELAIKYDI